MSMVINSNLASLNTFNQLNRNSGAMNNSLAKLSSGYAINSAADDAAGLAISEKMRGQIRCLDQASANSQDAISLVQTAEGALSETTEILQRMRELAVQASTDTLTDDDRTAVQDEVDQLRQEIDRIADTTEFNTKKLLNGDIAKSVSAGGTLAANNAVNEAKTVAGTNTKAGVYEVEITQSAEKATLGNDANATAAASGLTATDALASYTGDIQINGSTISISATDTLESLTSKINNVTSDTNVTAEIANDGTNYYIKLNSTAYGSDATISLSGTNAQLTDVFAATDGTDTTVSDAGTDVVGTIDGKSATGQGNTLTLKNSTSDADGLKVTFNDGAAAATGTVTVGTNNTLTFQIGANTDQTISLAINNMDASSLGVAGSNSTTAGLDLSTANLATNAIDTIDAAISTVSSERSKLGATENRLDHTINNLTTASENLTSAESRIRDVDMASEMAEYTKLSVLTQAATAMLAQANQQPQQVLSLLK